MCAASRPGLHRANLHEGYGPIDKIEPFRTPASSLHVNYKHLHYFLQVAEAGSVVRASERLHLSPQTVSGQIQVLEDRLGSALFTKEGRRLVLTDTGRMVQEYARDIFALGAELEAAVREKAQRARALEFRIGVADAVPKAIAYHLIQPALRLSEPVRLVCAEWRLDRLLAELALHRLDLVIADAPVPPEIGVRAYSHRLGASGIAFFAGPGVRQRHPQPFPACLEGAPLLLPGRDSAAGQRLQRWLEGRGLHPQVLGEFDDTALALEFGRRSEGFFTGPSVLADEIAATLDVQPVGLAEGLEEVYYAISVQRRISHPCVAAVTRAAQAIMPPAPLPEARRRRRPSPPPAA